VKVSELGEFGLIELVSKVVDANRDSESAAWKQVLVGIGDDTAAWQGDGCVQLATTDSLVQGTHFDLKYMHWEDLGWKAIAVNLSDIAAMGGVPKYAMVSLALPGELDANCVVRLYQGMVEVASRFDVAIVGGNIASADKVNITVSLIGSLKGKTPLLRSAALPGDLVAVTGYTGLAAAGLQMLKHKLKLDPKSSELLSEAHLKPVPRVKEGQNLLRLGVKAAIDISDGLIADLTHVCKASKVSATINKDLVPVHNILETHFPDDCERLALAGGEDYELLFTASNTVMEKVKRSVSCPVTVIGEITEGTPGKVKIVDNAGRTPDWQKKGWEHFKSER